MANPPPLPAYDWRINRRDENALLSVQQSITFEIREGLDVVVSNILNSHKCDQWLIYEVHREKEEAHTRALTSFVGAKLSQTEALDLARTYVFAIWKKDIALEPF